MPPSPMHAAPCFVPVYYPMVLSPQPQDKSISVTEDHQEISKVDPSSQHPVTMNSKTTPMRPIRQYNDPGSPSQMLIPAAYITSPITVPPPPPPHHHHPAAAAAAPMAHTGQYSSAVGYQDHGYHHHHQYQYHHHHHNRASSSSSPAACRSPGRAIFDHYLSEEGYHPADDSSVPSSPLSLGGYSIDGGHPPMPHHHLHHHTHHSNHSFENHGPTVSNAKHAMRRHAHAMAATQHSMDGPQHHRHQRSSSGSTLRFNKRTRSNYAADHHHHQREGDKGASGHADAGQTDAAYDVAKALCAMQGLLATRRDIHAAPREDGQGDDGNVGSDKSSSEQEIKERVPDDANDASTTASVDSTIAVPGAVMEYASLLVLYGITEEHAFKPMDVSPGVSCEEKQEEQARRLNARQRRTLRRAQERAIKAIQDAKVMIQDSGHGDGETGSDVSVMTCGDGKGAAEIDAFRRRDGAVLAAGAPLPPPPPPPPPPPGAKAPLGQNRMLSRFAPRTQNL